MSDYDIIGVPSFQMCQYGDRGGVTVTVTSHSGWHRRRDGWIMIVTVTVMGPAAARADGQCRSLYRLIRVTVAQC